MRGWAAQGPSNAAMPALGQSASRGAAGSCKPIRSLCAERRRGSATVLLSLFCLRASSTVHAGPTGAVPPPSVPHALLRARKAKATGMPRAGQRTGVMTHACSPDGAKRNPGLSRRSGIPDFASLHPGYERAVGQLNTQRGCAYSASFSAALAVSSRSSSRNIFSAFDCVSNTIVVRSGTV
jgi:hypothetical protein